MMYVIGIDPHKGSHTAAVLDREGEVRGELRVVAGRRQRDELLEFAAPFEPRTWAIEAASGWGSLLAQQLIAAGEAVLDVPPALSARARLLDGGSNDKTDRHDARSAAIVALRHRRLRAVARVDHRGCCACSLTATTTSRPCAHRPSAGCTRCCAYSSPVASHAS
jgi:transposase